MAGEPRGYRRLVVQSMHVVGLVRRVERDAGMLSIISGPVHGGSATVPEMAWQPKANAHLFARTRV